MVAVAAATLSTLRKPPRPSQTCHSKGRRGSALSPSRIVSVAAFCSHGLSAGGTVIKIPVTTYGDPDVFMLSWNVSKETAETTAKRLQAGFPGKGITFHVHWQMEAGFGHHDSIYLMSSTTNIRWVAWPLLAGTLHSIAAHFLPAEELFRLELEKPKLGPRPNTGMFLLQSPGRNMWKVLVWSLRMAWKHGALRKLRLHALVHHMPDWSPDNWRKVLGPAAHVFGGLHWCYGPNRWATDDDTMSATSRPRDNYFHKVFTMLNLAKRQGYEHIISFDDDVMLPPSSMAYLVDAGPLAYYSQGCGVVAPLLQNGVPSVELWAEAFLSAEERSILFQCFETAGLEWEHQPFYSPELGPELVPWNANIWYNRVKTRAKDDYKGIHPVRGNRTCMARALGLAVAKLPELWNEWRDDHGLLIDAQRNMPYLCNNAYLIRTDLYEEVLERSDLYRSGGADEVPLNLLLNERELPLCFVSNSFGIHPAYNHHPLREEMEQYTLAQVLKYSDGWDEYFEDKSITTFQPV